MGSILSIGSVGSILSIGSVGSILSIGSVGSTLSVGSLGSLVSILSAASSGSLCSLLSHRSVRALLSAGAGASVGAGARRPGAVATALGGEVPDPEIPHGAGGRAAHGGPETPRGREGSGRSGRKKGKGPRRKS